MSVRRPEIRALVAGNVISGFYVKNFEVNSSRYEACDVASVVFAIDTTKIDNSGTLWFEQDTTENISFVLEMRDAVVAASEWERFFDGQVDHVQYFPDKGLLEIECRDALAFLMDLRVQDSWINHTGEELLRVLIEAAGLTAQIDFPPESASIMTGQFWQIEHKRLSLLSHHRFQTAADVAFMISRDAGCDLYADGKTIVCSPVLSSDGNQAIVHDVRGTVLSRSFGRDLQADRGFVVHVASWDSRQRSATEIYYDGNSFSSTGPQDQRSVHGFRLPGRRLEDLKRFAVGKYARIAAHVRSGYVRLPGRSELRPRDFLRLGDGYWENPLAIDQVISRFSLEEGFLQELVLRNRGEVPVA
ncbi:hypothetical protein [Gluconobacter wancherniae]|uniref:Phage protein n=1 Tax=Gluconobacter wancherniae NBRC 103581 TaxID=656744 RepID=A0A511AZZ0_9PROT|nr:hypothetical protein [Gluconobacter wancherniae]MBF0854407.1 hypothetical protein [Gluconobacter wancherniae]GBD57468.1 hypothetical protein NBRC103581_02056 [Gluconobacter wancherniae NBRC 103581]GBR62714.1 hypothetical protein AA103581_0452 [Gluconobacter wancherniae NBRC 103581]GEK93758.1 hypothetical protein GWA01_15280 [Gluconobacter wancherniae NBRC 103581]